MFVLRSVHKRIAAMRFIPFAGDGRRARWCPWQRTRMQTRVRLEALEERCLLSSIFGITEFAVPSVSTAPDGITVGPDGNLWFTEQGADAIGRINPTTHAVSSFAYQPPVPHPRESRRGRTATSGSPILAQARSASPHSPHRNWW